MQRFEYKVLAAPRKGEKVRGAKTTADRFALVLTQTMNDHAREGWEYLRADTLPCEERSGLTGRSTTYQNMLVFRRLLPAQATAEPAGTLPEADPMDAALRHVTGPAPVPAPVSAPVVARPLFGKSPKLAAAGEMRADPRGEAPDPQARG